MSLLNKEDMLGELKRRNDLYPALKNFANGDKTLVKTTSNGQKSICHEDCPAGEDTKYRLYIKDTGNTLLAHCFNCGQSGWMFKDMDTLVLNEPLEVHQPRDNSTANLTASILKCTPISDVKIKTWLMLQGIQDEDITKLGLLQSRQGNLCVPLHSIELTNTDVLGYLLRFFGDSQGKRYHLNTMGPKHAVFEYQSTPHKNGGVTVLVEDYFSAYRINRATGLRTIALLGTSVKEDTLHYLSMEINNKIIIWLDKDFAGMEATSKVAQKVRDVVPPSVTFWSIEEQQAKSLSDEQIRETLKAYL
jgi:5S rRNA maturation endonuclease (ribonuclease M5)